MEERVSHVTGKESSKRAVAVLLKPALDEQ
jgi:hypothetical protein